MTRRVEAPKGKATSGVQVSGVGLDSEGRGSFGAQLDYPGSTTRSLRILECMFVG
jgi:hypothetical protein